MLDYSSKIVRIEARGRTQGERVEEKIRTTIGTAANQRKVLSSGRIVGHNQYKQEWISRRRNKYKKDKYGHIPGEIDYKDENPFDVLKNGE